ncbi:hypothetical protein Avbf_00665, partial [Armadillidium vulgare]
FNRGEDVHEAILFLQKEHETILSGLHTQIEDLQAKCDELTFETHLKHIVSNEEDILRKKVSELRNVVIEREKEVEMCKEMLEKQEKKLEEEREHHRWKELKLQQQIDVGNQRNQELKNEVARLKGQVHDLKVFSSALRTSSGLSHSTNQRNWSATTKSSLSSTKPSTGSQLKSSQESLDSIGPRSLGSEEGDIGSWREARLGGVNGRFSSLRSNNGRPNSTQSSHHGSLPPLSSSPVPSRPTSSTSIVTLPPISKPEIGASKSVSRPYVRKQLRLLSAPHIDNSIKPRRFPP